MASPTSNDLPKTYDPAAVESEAYRVWLEERAFHVEPQAPGDPYAIVIPPPNVTAALHLGHALNNTIQDILIRQHRMKADNTVWLPGTDHAGIATQTVVEKRVLAEEGKRRTDFAREAFVARIQVWKDEYEQRITEQLKAMGCSCDWERQAFTMDPPRARAVREAFFRLFKDGLIYRGKRLVNWDPASQTALADDEVEMEEVDGHFYYLRYPLTDGTGHVTVATTRPETMLGDTAVAINPKDPRAVELRGKLVRLPIVGREIRIIEDDYVVLPDPNSDDAKAKYASGYLKVTPAHDPNDWDIGQRHKLAAINVMAPDASISDKYGWTDVGDAGFLLGKSREEARKLIVDWFRQNGLLEEIKPYRHSVGHSYRSHVPIEPYLSDQWYCKVTDERLAGAALKAMASEQRDDGPTRPPLQSRDREGAVFPESPDNAQNSAQDTSASPQPSEFPIAYLITFTTYGTWLHGKDSGSVHHELNQFGTPQLIGDESLERQEIGQLKGPPVSLDEARRSVVRDTIADVATHRGWTLQIVHVRSTHIHAVISAEVSPEKVMNDLKSYSKRRLRESGLVGPEEQVWTRHGSTRYLWHEKMVQDAFDYVSDRQGEVIPPGPLVPALLNEATPLGRLRADDAIARDQRTPLPYGRGSEIPGSSKGGLRFYPSRYAKTFQTWHENLRDWCISRQLWWGHRIPVWSRSFQRDYNKSDTPPGFQSWLTTADDESLKPELRGSMSRQRTTDPASGTTWDFICIAPGRSDVEQLLESFGFTQDPDVLDTWFSSGLWPMSTLNWPENTPELEKWNPSSVLCTAREIITLWVSRMVMFNLYFRNCLPFHDVFIHAMIQDGDGQKMSKSLGNGVDPLDIIHSHGADAMRFTLAAMTTHTQDLRMPVELVDPWSGQAFPPVKITTPSGYVVAAPIQTSPKDPGKKMVSSYGQISGTAKPTAEMPLAKNTSSKFDLGRNFCNKLWNAARFAISNLASVPPEPADPARWSLADRWILGRLHRTIADVDEALAQYRFDVYAKGCYDFFWRDLCDWYLEVIKPAMKDPARVGQTANVLAAVLDGALRLLHPMIPFITETVWWHLNAVRPERGLPGRLGLPPSERLIRARWPRAGEFDESADTAFNAIQEIVGSIRNLRNEYKVETKRSVNVFIVAPGEMLSTLDENRRTIELLGTCKLRQIGTIAPTVANAARAQIAGCEVFVEAAVDEGAEKQRLAKQSEDLKRQIAALRGRLSNEAYTAKAPAHLVQQTRDQLAAAEADLQKIGN